MSTLCCAVVVGGSSDALSPMRIRAPAAAEPDLSGDDEAATTPEASTDSENDSSFESDEDNSSGSRRKSPTRPGHRGWPGCINSGGKETQYQQQIQNPQPLRKVRFTLHDDAQPNLRVSGAMYRKRWGKGRRAAIRDSALADVGMMRSVDLAQQQQGARPRSNPTSQRIKSATTGATDSTRRAWKKRSVAAAAPFKSTSTNIGTTSASPSTSASSSAAAASASAPSPFCRGTAYSTLPPTPASPKKRKASALSSFSSVSSSPPPPSSSSSSSPRARGGGSGRSPRGAAVVAAAVAQGGAATASELEAAAAAKATPAAATPAAAAGAQPMDLSFEEAAQEEEVDLTCKEELGLSCQGEIRTPICRFLLPCWPEGVEGYEEAGGWRRLGGSYTRENFPRGRRSI